MKMNKFCWGGGVLTCSGIQGCAAQVLNLTKRIQFHKNCKRKKNVKSAIFEIEKLLEVELGFAKMLKKQSNQLFLREKNP